MKIKKLIASLLVFAMASFTILSTTACAPDPEGLIREAITKEFDSYKNMDEDVIGDIAQSAENQGLSELGIDSIEFANIVLDGFDYAINSITVDGDNATAELTIVSKSATDFEKSLSAAMDQLQTSPEIANMTDDEKTALIGQTVMNSFQDIDIVNEDVTIEYVKSNGTWTPVNSAEALGSLDSVVFAQSIS